ncbi:MAG: hypothetical protein M9894_03930 [Planctomycetes bacterium]|nr:hypothetical protein [Planctomycetota bacterium]
MKPALRCTYCHDALTRDEAAFCAACLAPQHAACRREHGRCAATGCAERGVVRPRHARRSRWAPGEALPAREAPAEGRLAITATFAALAALAGLLVGLEAGRAERGARPALVLHGPPPPDPAVVQRPSWPRPRLSHPVELRADALTITTEVHEGERLVVAPLREAVHALRLREDGTSQLLLVSPLEARGVSMRLPAADDTRWTHVHDDPPTVVDVDATHTDHPRLRRRAATPEELRRVAGLEGTPLRGGE